MKKLLLNALFLGCTTLGFAQPAFTEKTVHDINKRFIEDPKKSMSEDFSTDYVLHGGEGQKATAEQLGKMMAGVKHTSWETTDLTIKQYGNVAIANGITKHSLVSLNDNVTHAYHVRGTYVYEYQKDRWREVSAHHTHVLAPQASEEAVIKTVLEKETTAWNARDGESMASCWANTEYALTAVYHGVMARNNGVAYSPNTKKDRPEAIKAMVASMPKPDGTTFKNENYVMNINGTSAFVHFYETTTAGDGSKRSDYAIRYLEKVNGEWKIVYVGGIKDK